MPGKHPKIPKIVIMTCLFYFPITTEGWGVHRPSCVFFGKSTDLVNPV